MSYELVSVGVAPLVVDVPAEGLEEGVDELAAELGLVVAARAVGVAVAREALDEVGDEGGRCHAVPPWRWCPCRRRVSRGGRRQSRRRVSSVKCRVSRGRGQGGGARKRARRRRGAGARRADSREPSALPVFHPSTPPIRPPCAGFHNVRFGAADVRFGSVGRRGYGHPGAPEGGSGGHACTHPALQPSDPSPFVKEFTMSEPARPPSPIRRGREEWRAARSQT